MVDPAGQTLAVSRLAPKQSALSAHTMSEPPASDASDATQTPATTKCSCHDFHRGAQSLERVDEQAIPCSVRRPGELEPCCNIGGADFWRKRPVSYCGSVMVSKICRVELPDCPAAAVHRYHGEFEKVAIEESRVRRSCPQEDWRMSRVVTCDSRGPSRKRNTATGRASLTITWQLQQTWASGL